MPTLSSKHSNAQTIFYSSFDGGLNLSVPSESLPKNELKEAINVEFSPLTGAMKVRGGLVWSGRFEEEIDFVVPVRGRKGFLARVKGTRRLYYFLWNNILTVSGELTGDGDISIASWVDAEDNDCWLIASGGKLQKFSDKGIPELTTIDSSPEECRQVFVRNGRVGVLNGTDTISFSWVGDCESWNTDDNDISTGQYVDIGYKDGMNIDAVIPLSKDLIIFKSPTREPDKGTIWRLTGDFSSDLQVLEAAHNTGTYSPRSIKAVANDVFYVTLSGLSSLSNVTAYGEVKTSWPDRQVSNALTPQIDGTAELWDVSVKQQLWVLPSKDEEQIWVLDYARGIWTKFKFPAKITHAVGVDDRLYVFIGRDLYEVIDGYTQDDMKDTGYETIEAVMRLGTIIHNKQTLVKGAFASFELMPECKAELWLGKFKMPFSYGGTIDRIYDPPNDTDIAYEDDDPLFPEGGVLTARRRCMVRDWQITPEVHMYGGGCAISTMGLEVVEV